MEFKAPCQHCGQNIAFPVQAIGLQTNCPHCGQNTLLAAAVAPPVMAASAGATSARPQLVKAQKSRGVYIVLALLLGMLGVHNFYAGYHGKGLAQLLLTVCLGWIFVGLLINFIWIIAELFSVTTDAEGDPMT